MSDWLSPLAAVITTGEEPLEKSPEQKKLNVKYF